METTQDEKRAADELACRAAYDDRYHKIRAAVSYDEFHAIWFKALESHAAYEDDLERLAEIGAAVDAGNLDPDKHELVFLKLTKGTATPEVMNDLQRIGGAISSGEKIGVVAGSAALSMARIAKLVDEKFTSGNEIPVERITITRAELGL